MMANRSFGAVGRQVDWPSTLRRLGINAEYLTGKHGPCPGCGGVDRFRFDNKGGRGTWYCSSGGGEPSFGDGFDLLHHAFGWTPKEALAAVVGHINPGIRLREPAPKPPSAPPSTQAYAVTIWARVDRSDDAVASHLYARQKGIGWHAGAGRAHVSGRIVGKDADCVVVPIREIETGNVAAVQCITASGAKQTFGPVKGSAFIIGNDLDSSSGWFVVEGWADAASVFREFGTCAFAAMGKDFRVLTDRIVERYQPRSLLLVEDAE